MIEPGTEKELHLLRFDTQTADEIVVIPDFLEILSEVTGNIYIYI